MKPSHLAMLALASLGVGGMASANIATPPAITAKTPSSAKINRGPSAQAIINYQAFKTGGWFGADHSPASYHRKNQRQIRLARRRKHAAGFKNAFKK